VVVIAMVEMDEMDEIVVEKKDFVPTTEPI
jgi:hypothetical protein